MTSTFRSPGYALGPPTFWGAEPPGKTGEIHSHNLKTWKIKRSGFRGPVFRIAHADTAVTGQQNISAASQEGLGRSGVRMLSEVCQGHKRAFGAIRGRRV